MNQSPQSLQGIPEELRKKLEDWESKKPLNRSVTLLSDIADMIQHVVEFLEDTSEKTEQSTKQMGAVLLDISEKISEANSKEAPEMPDFAKPIVKAIEKATKEQLAKIGELEVNPEFKPEFKPNIDVAAPVVNVNAPSLTPLKNLLKDELPAAFEEAIKLIPKTEPTDVSGLEDLLRQMSESMLEQLASIDHAVRLKPQPGSMKVTNPDGTTVGAAKPTDAYAIRDLEDTGTYKYYGFENSVGAWYIMRKTLATSAFLYAAGSSDYSTAWTNRASQTYASYSSTF